MTNGNFQNYELVGYDDLLLYAMWSIQQENKKLIWEQIVIKAFELFPKRFGLPNYEDKYPDSAQVDRSLLRCRDKRYVTGKRAQDYKITNLGLSAIDAIKEKLGQKTVQKKSTTSINKKTKAGRLIYHVKNSTAFKKFQKQENLDTISQYDISSLLVCPLDATPETKIRQLNLLKDEMKMGGHTDFFNFLSWVEDRFIAPLSLEKKKRGMFG